MFITLIFLLAARLIVHIADAPCHGRQFHNLEDDYPDGDKLKRDLASILENLHTGKMNQTYHFYHLYNYTKKMLQEFRQVEGVPKDWIQVSFWGSALGLFRKSSLSFSS